MSLEFDHIFCFCNPELKEERILVENGFNLTSGKIHQGQGTANKSVLFKQNYLELIFIKSIQEARNNILRLDKRADWKASKSSPFGLAFRGELPKSLENDFWDYSPPYLKGIKIKIHKLNEADPSLPLIFIMPKSRFTIDEKMIDYVPHNNLVLNIEHVYLTTNSKVNLAGLDFDRITFRSDEHPKAELIFDKSDFKRVELNQLLVLGSKF